MSTTSKAALISARELPKVVDAAIKAAGDKGHAGPFVLRWDIAGKVIREAEAHAFATNVAKQLGAAGHEVSPAVLTIGGETLAGFVERNALPQFREF